MPNTNKNEKEENRVFMDFLRSLFSLKDSQIILLKRVLNGYTLAEIASKNGVSRQAVSQSFKRICKRNKVIGRALGGERFHRVEH